ncbi:hypothetical protein ELOC111193_15400 [Elizabethkingia occulta]|uniref:hypothetical protein n=1 Tax=Elizabethkingia occulta TaxID=1867263 RepID=UPI001FE97605|nr:hypothetical protein [Elizabethkingia occulta]
MLIQINNITTRTIQKPEHKAFYQIFLIHEPSEVIVDFTTYGKQPEYQYFKNLKECSY